jgi:hypothetical protein
MAVVLLPIEMMDRTYSPRRRIFARLAILPSLISIVSRRRVPFPVKYRMDVIRSSLMTADWLSLPPALIRVATDRSVRWVVPAVGLSHPT